MLKHILIILLLPTMSFAGIEKAEELKMKTFYSLFQKSLKQARSDHTFCTLSINPNSLEINPMVIYTNPSEDYGPDIPEQFTNCYYEYARDSLSLLCEKERELKQTIQIFEEKGETKDSLELKKKQLEFIISERQALEKKGSSITANSFQKHETAQVVVGPDKSDSVFHKLSQLGYGLNSCDKALTFVPTFIPEEMLLRKDGTSINK